MAAEYNFPAIIRGNTFKARKLRIKVNGLPLDLTGAIFCMQLKNFNSSVPVHTFSHSISAPLVGEITLNKWNVDRYAGTYHYDTKITLANGNVLTYIYGIFPIKQNVSECQ